MAGFEEALNALLADPDAMGQIMALAGKLGGPAEQETSPEEVPPEDCSSPPEDLPPFPDLAQLEQMGRLFQMFQSQGQTNKETTALLLALRPFLREDRRRKLDRAMKLAGMSQTARQAYSLWKEGELHL